MSLPKPATSNAVAAVSVAGLLWLIGCLCLSPGLASAQSMCGRDWTVGSACPISGRSVSVTGKLVALNEADYYVFRAAANTQIKLMVFDRQPRSCIARSACSSIDAALYDSPGVEDYVDASTANVANNVRSASSAPYILQTAGTYYLRVSAENAEVPYRVRIVSSPGVTIPGRSHANGTSAAGHQAAHHSGGDTAIGGLIVLALLGLIIRAIRRRRRRQDARAHADWKRIQGRLPTSWPPTDHRSLAGQIVEHYQPVPKGVKVHMKFGPGSPPRDTFWKNKLATPAVGQWVIFEAHMVDENTHSGAPYLRADRVLETLPADTERRARRHARWLKRQARRAMADPSEPTADGQRDDGDEDQHEPRGDDPNNAGSGGPPPNTADGRPDWAFEELDLDVSADLKETSARRRDMAARYHPDRAATTTPEIRELAAERLKLINAAYEAIARWLNSQAATV